MKSPIERFRARVETRNGSDCWHWIGAKNGDGYGTFYDGRTVLAHRWAYEHWIGPVPDGLELDHVVCDNRACANPSHVEPVTHLANIRRGGRGGNARKTHCPAGHPYAGDNLYVDPSGRRNCRMCRREIGRRYRALHPERVRECQRRSYYTLRRSTRRSIGPATSVTPGP